VYTAYCVVTGGPSVEIKTETNSTDITVLPHWASRPTKLATKHALI